MWNASFKLTLFGCVISICCVGFASLDVVCDKLIVPRMFVCSSFLISVCMFIVSKALLISSATVIVRAGGAIWLAGLPKKRNRAPISGGREERGSCTPPYVVRLQTCGRKMDDPNFQFIFADQPVLSQAAGVVGTLNCLCFI